MSLSVYSAIDEDDLLKLGLAIKNYDKKNVFPLHYSAVHGSQEAIQLLLDAGFDINAVHRLDFTTPLTNTLRFRSRSLPDILMFLIESGADINQVLPTTPLMAACDASGIKYVEQLLKLGVNVNQQSNVGLTALMYVCVTGRISLASILLEHGADINIQDAEGNTALHYALERGTLAIARQLAQAGTNLRLKNVEGLRPLEVARRHITDTDLFREISLYLIP